MLYAIEAIKTRLATLIEESEEPLQEMWGICRKLADEGLTDYWPDPATRPRQFVENLVAASPLWIEAMQAVRTEIEVQSVESPEAMINLLLPASSA